MRQGRRHRDLHTSRVAKSAPRRAQARRYGRTTPQSTRKKRRTQRRLGAPRAHSSVGGSCMRSTHSRRTRPESTKEDHEGVPSEIRRVRSTARVGWDRVGARKRRGGGYAEDLAAGAGLVILGSGWWYRSSPEVVEPVPPATADPCRNVFEAYVPPERIGRNVRGYPTADGPEAIAAGTLY